MLGVICTSLSIVYVYEQGVGVGVGVGGCVGDNDDNDDDDDAEDDTTLPSNLRPTTRECVHLVTIIIIIIIERKDLGGVMSKDCKDAAKNSDKTRVRRKVRTEYLSDEIVGRAVEVRKTSDEQFRLQLTSKGRQ